MVAENIQTGTHAQLLEAASLAARIKHEVQAEIESMVSERGVRPCLAAVRVGDDPA